MGGRGRHWSRSAVRGDRTARPGVFEILLLHSQSPFNKTDYPEIFRKVSLGSGEQCSDPTAGNTCTECLERQSEGGWVIAGDTCRGAPSCPLWPPAKSQFLNFSRMAMCCGHAGPFKPQSKVKLSEYFELLARNAHEMASTSGDLAWYEPEAGP